MNKSRKRVEQDYARNAIADGNTKAGKYEAKMAVKEAAGESPATMYGKKKGSPAHNQNKGYESAGQERKNLMNDNPIDSRASGGSWMSKHTSSRMGSPMRMDYGSPMEKELVGKQGNLPEALKSKIEAAPEMRREGSPMHQDRTLNAKGQTQQEVNDSRLSDITSAQKAASDFSNKINSNKVGFNDDQLKALQGKLDKLNLSSDQAIGRQNFSADSINKVNKGFKAADIKKQNDAFNALMGGK